MTNALIDAELLARFNTDEMRDVLFGPPPDPTPDQQAEYDRLCREHRKIQKQIDALLAAIPLKQSKSY